MTERGTTGRSYDRVAGDYAAQILDELKHKPFDRGFLDTFAELAGKGTVADVGCGPGHVGAYLAARGVRTVGLDLSPAMCAIAVKTSSLDADGEVLELREAGLQLIARLDRSPHARLEHESNRSYLFVSRG
jgi:SAM-dependent methyltransferase